MPEKITAQVGDKQIIIETGKLAKQADGAVTVQLGDTIVIVAAVAATKAREGQDFSRSPWITAKKRRRRAGFPAATSNVKAAPPKRKSSPRA